MRKRILSLFIAVAMTIAMLPAIAIPALAVAEDSAVTFKLEEVNAAAGVHKLVFQAKTTTNIALFNAIFSFDNTILKQINRDGTTEVAIEDEATAPITTTPFTPIAKTVYGGTAAPAKFNKWRILDTRTAFDYTLYVADDYIASNGSYVDMFSFTFKLLEGKTIEDIKADTFRFETADNQDHMLDLFFTGGEDNWYGILLDETDGDTTSQYRWGHANTLGWEEYTEGEIASVVNPYAPADVPEATVESVTITGSAGALLTSQPAKITLVNETVVATGLLNWEASGWFTGLPEGMTATASAAENAASITITFGGRPAAESSAAFDITIPGDVLTSGKALDVAENTNAKLSIGPKDVTPPTVMSVTPAGAGAPTSGSIVITFSEAMDPAVAGAVKLNDLDALAKGTWSEGNTVYTAAYSGLAYTTEYTVNISGFADISDNVMAANSANKFTTTAPVLSGTVELTLNPTIGAVTAAATGGSTGEPGDLTYTWSGGATGTGATVTPGLGTAATCTVTKAGYSGTITGTVTVYEVEVALSGNETGDSAAIAAPFGEIDDEVTIAYVVAETANNNTVAFTGATVTDNKNGTAAYQIAAADAVSGKITITATFTHENDPTYTTTISIPKVNGNAPAADVTNPQAAIQGATVNLPKLTPNDGFTFKTWEVVSGGVTLTSADQNPGASFVMGSTDVQVKAIFEASPLTFTNKTLAGGMLGAAYSDSVTAPTGGSGTYTYTATVPAGLAMSADGAITGTPNAVVTAQTFTVTVTDTITGATAAAAYTITIADAPTYGIALNPAGNKVFDAAAFGYGAQTPYSVTIRNTGNQSTGALEIKLTGDDADCFTLSKTSAASIAAGASDSFTVVPNTGLDYGTYGATVSVSGGDVGTVSFDVSFTVTKTLPTVEDLTYTIPSHTFNGSAQGIGTVTGASGIGEITVKYNGSDTPPTNAGTYTLTADIAEGMNYGPVTGMALGTYTIAPLDLSQATVAADFGTVTYNGAAQTPAPVSVSFDGAAVTQAAYTLSGWASNTNAGSASVLISGLGNYAGSKEISFTIAAKQLTLQADDKFIAIGAEEPAYTYVVLGLIGGDTAGSIIDEAPVLSVADFDSAALGTMEIVISGGTVSSANYSIADYISGTLTVTDKAPVTIGGVNVASKAYDGAAISPAGTPTVQSGDGEVSDHDALVYTYTDLLTNTSSGDAPTDAGEYTLVISTDTADAQYIGVSAIIPFTIGKATVTITADNKSVKKGGTEPIYTHKVTGLAQGETLGGDLTVECPTADMNTVGSYPIIAGGAAVPNTSNYNEAIVYINGTLTVTPSDDGGTPTPTPSPSPDPTPQNPSLPAGDGQVSISYTQSGGTVTLSLPDAKVSEMIKASNNDTAIIDLTSVTNTTTASLPTAALSKLADAGLAVKLKLPAGTLTLDAQAVASIAGQAGTKVSVEFKQLKASDLNQVQQGVVKDGDIIVDINVLSGKAKITSLGGSLSVTVDYTGPLPSAVWYLNEAGELEKLSCTYDAATKTVTFITDHLSVYVVGEDTQTPLPFTDVKEDDWFYGDVSYVFEHGLMNGTSATLFAPDMSLTRGMIVTILYRHAGEPDVSTLANPFSDVPASQYYADAVKWAAANEIVNGVGEGRYAPDSKITRQDLAVILMRYMSHLNATPSVTSQWITFADEADIADYAVDAIQTFNKLEIINGKGTNTEGQIIVDPKGNATRAEIAAILHRFILTIEE